MNVQDLAGADSFMLAPGHELRRATSDEIGFIKDTVKGLRPTPHFQYMDFWEWRWPHGRGTVQILPEAEWRYFVIAFKGSNTTIEEFQGAFDLAPLELEVGFTALYTDSRGRGVAWLPGRLFHVLESAVRSDSFFVRVSASDIGEMQTINSQLQQDDPRLADVKRLVTQLSQLKGLPHNSPLRFLGYFAVLESLLTHPPKPSDTYDSITRQVKMKLALLDNRWPRKINYAPFGGTPAETIWTKMYDYPSRVAHGGPPEITGKLAVLKSHDTALTLIKDTVKAIIRQALSEP